LDVTREMKKTVHRYGALLWLLNPNIRLTSPDAGGASNSPWQGNNQRRPHTAAFSVNSYQLNVNGYV